MGEDTGLDVSDDLIQEQAYLVSRGVRPLAIVGPIPLAETCPLEVEFIRLNQMVGSLATPSIPFVLPRRDMDCAMVGFASHQWALAKFLMTTVLKGVSSMKLSRGLWITQRLAWHLAHRIRMSWEEG